MMRRDVLLLPSGRITYLLLQWRIKITSAVSHHELRKNSFISGVLSVCVTVSFAQSKNRELFTEDWRFILDSNNNYSNLSVNDVSWRSLNLPHDWVSNCHLIQLVRQAPEAVHYAAVGVGTAKHLQFL